jgi:hypothetical protein
MEVKRNELVLRMEGDQLIRLREDSRVTLTPWIKDLFRILAEALGCGVEDVIYHNMMVDHHTGVLWNALPYPILVLLETKDSSETALACAVLESILETEPKCLAGPWENRDLPDDPVQARKDLDEWLAGEPEPDFDWHIRKALEDALAGRWGELPAFKEALEGYYGPLTGDEGERVAAGLMPRGDKGSRSVLRQYKARARDLLRIMLGFNTRETIDAIADEMMNVRAELLDL